MIVRGLGVSSLEATEINDQPQALPRGAVERDGARPKRARAGEPSGAGRLGLAGPRRRLRAPPGRSGDAPDPHRPRLHRRSAPARVRAEHLAAARGRRAPARVGLVRLHLRLLFDRPNFMHYLHICDSKREKCPNVNAKNRKINSFRVIDYFTRKKPFEVVSPIENQSLHYSFRINYYFLDTNNDGNTFTTMNNMITGDVTSVNLATQAFGQDLKNLGQLINLNNLDNLGSPLALVQQIYSITGTIPVVSIMFVAVGIPTEVIINLTNPSVSVTDAVQKVNVTMGDCCDAAAECVLKPIKGTKITDVHLLTAFDEEYKNIKQRHEEFATQLKIQHGELKQKF